jgi:hypothetical protein
VGDAARGRFLHFQFPRDATPPPALELLAALRDEATELTAAEQEPGVPESTALSHLRGQENSSATVKPQHTAHQAEPTRAAPTQAEPQQAVLINIEPFQTKPTQTLPTQAELQRAAPVQDVQSDSAAARILPFVRGPIPTLRADAARADGALRSLEKVRDAKIQMYGVAYKLAVKRRAELEAAENDALQRRTEMEAAENNVLQGRALAEAAHALLRQGENNTRQVAMHAQSCTPNSDDPERDWERERAQAMQILNPHVRRWELKEANRRWRERDPARAGLVLSQRAQRWQDNGREQRGQNSRRGRG